VSSTVALLHAARSSLIAAALVDAIVFNASSPDAAPEPDATADLLARCDDLITAAQSTRAVLEHMPPEETPWQRL
jgi:hypothetical protein